MELKVTRLICRNGPGAKEDTSVAIGLGYTPFPPRTVTPIRPTGERGIKGEVNESMNDRKDILWFYYCFIIVLYVYD